MKDKIRDILHLYLGSTCTYYHSTMKRHITEPFTAQLLKCIHHPPSNIVNLTLVLRQLSSMTEEEASECYHRVMGGSYGVTNPKHALQNYHFPSMNIQQLSAGTAHLLKKGFDLFNLIPEGLAIDADTLKTDKN